MIAISNEDYRKVKRLLLALYHSKGETLKCIEDRRQAWLLLRKWSKREKRSVSASNSKDI